MLQGSRIWGSSWREERAASYGIDPDELEEHYRKRTTLGVNIFPEDIAQAVLHFASPARSGKSTGNMLNVDGGVPRGLRAVGERQLRLGRGGSEAPRRPRVSILWKTALYASSSR